MRLCGPKDCRNCLAINQPRTSLDTFAVAIPVCRSPVGIAYWLSTTGQLSSKVGPCSLARFGHVIRLPVASFASNCEKGLLIFLSHSVGGSPIGIRFPELKSGVGVLIIENFTKVAWEFLGNEV